MKNILISFSGGRTSAFMAKMIQLHPIYKDYKKLFIFANTGKEKEETLVFVDKCDKEFNLNLVWVEADVNQEKGKGTNYKVVDFETASRKGEPFEKVIRKYGLPSKVYRHCTRDLKEIPIDKYAKEYFNGEEYLTAIGIRADERHRVGNNPKKIYPLSLSGIDEKIVRDFWDRQDFDLELKDYEGNCDLCFLKSVRKKLTIIKQNPDTAKWWADMEDAYEGVTLKENVTFATHRVKFDAHRDLSIPDLIEMAKQPFVMAHDKHELRKQQGNLFDMDIDLEFDCFCKSN
jgi:hypothetical protein